MRIELKRDWPPAERAARRLAGHANAARGDSILWLIGVDEKIGVVGASANELSNWWAKVASCFEGVSPDLTDLVVPFNGKSVLALSFATDRAPFLVRNVASVGGGVEFEVPWREATAVRSARRSDLLRILVPRQKLPQIEVLKLACSGSENDNRTLGYAFAWSLQVSLYVIPPDERLVVLPIHRCEAYLEVESARTWEALAHLSFNNSYGWGNRTGSATIEATMNEAVISGPGRLEFKALSQESAVPSTIGEIGSCEVVLRSAKEPSGIVITSELRQVSASSFEGTNIDVA